MSAYERAFPQTASVTPAGDFIWPASYGEGGMTNREYFAARAMQGIIAHYGVMQEKPPVCAKSAVEFADALIAELANPPAANLEGQVSR